MAIANEASTLRRSPPDITTRQVALLTQAPQPAAVRTGRCAMASPGRVATPDSWQRLMLVSGASVRPRRARSCGNLQAVTSLRPRRLDLGEARRLYESGLSFAQVGLELGYSATWLARLFKATGIPSRPDGRPLTTPAPPVDIGELVRLREVGWTYPQLGARYGLSDDAVRSRYLRAKGLPLRRAEADRRGVPFHPFDR